MNKRPGWHQDVVGVGAMPGAASVGDVAVGAKLLVTQGADLTNAAASVVVDHDPVTDFQALRRPGSQIFNHAARLMAGNIIRGLLGAVAMKVGAAQAGGSNFD